MFVVCVYVCLYVCMCVCMYIYLYVCMYAYAVNVDTLACINFCGFMKMGNFTRIKIHVLSITGSIGYYKSNFLSVHIFVDI